MQDTTPATIRLSGPMTLQTIAETHQALLGDFNNHDAITLDLSDIDDVDVSFIQLIESARLSAAQDGKAFNLAAPATDGLLEALQRGGFIGDGAAAPTEARTQFWLAC